MSFPDFHSDSRPHTLDITRIPDFPPRMMLPVTNDPLSYSPDPKSRSNRFGWVFLVTIVIKINLPFEELQGSAWAIQDSFGNEMFLILRFKDIARLKELEANMKAGWMLSIRRATKQQLMLPSAPGSRKKEEWWCVILKDEDFDRVRVSRSFAPVLLLSISLQPRF